MWLENGAADAYQPGREQGAPHEEIPAYLLNHQEHSCAVSHAPCCATSQCTAAQHPEPHDDVYTCTILREDGVLTTVYVLLPSSPVPLINPGSPDRPNPKPRDNSCVVCPDPHQPFTKKAKMMNLASIAMMPQGAGAPNNPYKKPTSTARTSDSATSEGCAFHIKQPDLPSLDELVGPHRAAFSVAAVLEYTVNTKPAFYDGASQDQIQAAAGLGNMVFDTYDYPWSKQELLGTVNIFKSNNDLRPLLLAAVPDLALVPPIQDICEGWKGEWDYDGWVAAYGPFFFNPGEPEINPWNKLTPQGKKWGYYHLAKALNQGWGFKTTFDGFPHTGDHKWCQGKGATWRTFARSPTPSPPPPPRPAIPTPPNTPAATVKLEAATPGTAPAPAVTGPNTNTTPTTTKPANGMKPVTLSLTRATGANTVPSGYIWAALPVYNSSPTPASPKLPPSNSPKAGAGSFYTFQAAA